MTTLLILLASVLGFFYLFVKKKHSYWKNVGVPNPDPLFWFGNMWEAFTMKKHFGIVCTELYKMYPEYKYIGLYKFLQPAILVRDPELIERVMIKDFSHFDANDLSIDPSADDILGKHPFVLKGSKWKEARGQWSPNFSNSKLKAVFPLMEEVSERLVNYINKKIETSEANCMDAKDLSLKFTTENVASCIYGLQANAFEKEESEFVRIARSLGSVSLISGIKILIIRMFPSLSSLFKIKLFSNEARDYFIHIIQQTLDYRQKNNIVRNDFLDVLKRVKETTPGFTDLDILAHTAGFFGDGVETSGATLSYILYELAVHPEVQNKFVKEIDEVILKNGSITFDKLMQMKYLDAIINETLRKDSPALALHKLCTRDYTFPHPKDENGNPIVIKKNTSVIIPVSGLQEDETFYSKAEKFIPERFYEQEPITKCTFLPFGEGPRVCVGLKFGMVQIKLALVQMIRNFEVSLNNKTEEPLGCHPCTLSRCPLKGIWIGLSPRKSA